MIPFTLIVDLGENLNPVANSLTTVDYVKPILEETFARGESRNLK